MVSQRSTTGPRPTTETTAVVVDDPHGERGTLMSIFPTAVYTAAATSRSAPNHPKNPTFQPLTVASRPRKLTPHHGRNREMSATTPLPRIAHSRLLYRLGSNVM